MAIFSETQSIFTHRMDSPVGSIYMAVDKAGAVVQTSFTAFENLKSTVFPANARLEENKYACGELAYQLSEYFAGNLKVFNIDVILHGTDFQIDVWSRLQKIPYGHSMTYGEVAQKIGRKLAAQAVGRAVGINPTPIVIPCHRVLPKSGGIGEYALNAIEQERGRSIKEYLLELERIERN